MALSNELISQFVKATKDDTKTKTDKTVYGTIVEYNGSKYVRLDGSELLTPISSTSKVDNDERVIVTIKNHTATVTGNITSPSGKASDIETIGSKISEFEVIIADKVSTKDLEAVNANIENLQADYVTINGALEAAVADINTLEADNATIKGSLDAVNADIENLEADNVTINNKLSAADADIKSLQADNVVIRENLVADEAAIGSLDAKIVTINGSLTAHQADIEDLKTNKLSATDADLKYANIDFSNIGKAAIEYFYATSGLIKDVVVGEGTVTGELVGVTISGDLIKGNTVIADKLVIKGDDGLYYKLNTDGITTETEQTDYNSLNGSVIKAKSITATKISVKDLVAFDATIGGFEITDNSIYSGVKSSASNTTRGIYMDNDGQLAFGDANNYVKFYKDTDGTYKLTISASSIVLGGSGKNVEETLDSIKEDVDSIEIGATNLLRYTNLEDYWNEWIAWQTSVLEFSDGYLKITPGTDETSCGTYPPKLSSLTNGTEYTVSFMAYAEEVTDLNYCYIMADGGDTSLGVTIPVTIAPERYSFVFTTTKEYTNASIMIGRSFTDNPLAIYVKDLKLEEGNRATNWSPAPEDVRNEISSAQSAADSAQGMATENSSRLDGAWNEIDAINSTIRNLVRGQNGETLMTQTESGWVFDFSSVQNTLNSMTENVDNLNTNATLTDSQIEILKSTVSDLGVYTEYIEFGVDNGKPCIILGEHDSEFKVVITNTDIRFMEGSNIPAYISNQSLNIQKAVISQELKQGGFVWMARSNGNYGLLWRGE